jgi:hypothetical protein
MHYFYLKGGVFYGVLRSSQEAGSEEASEKGEEEIIAISNLRIDYEFTNALYCSIIVVL